MEVNRKNYFSKEMSLKYMGSSQYKDFINCEAMAIAKINGDYSISDNVALVQGSYMDSLFEGNSEEFKTEHPEMFTKKGTQLLKSFADVENSYNSVSHDKLFMHYCLGEQQKIFTFEIAGVPFKIMTDSLLPDIIIDRKYMRDMQDIWSEKEHKKVPFFEYWGYDIQAAIYREGVRQNLGVELPFALAPITKEKQADHELIKFDNYILDDALEKVKANVPYFYAIKQGLIDASGCGVCDYCKSIKTVSDFKMASSFMNYVDLEDDILLEDN